MSKKLAIGTDLVLLDVKAGSGAFMKTPEDAAELAEACAALAKDWGRPTRAAVTDMSQPLGEAIGNALDIVEAVRLLRGELHGRLRDAAVVFAGEAVSRLLGVPMGEGRARAAAALDSGEALEAFRRMIQAQGGDPRVVDEPEQVLPSAPVRRPITAERAGTLAAVDAEGLGRASGDLGAGRKKKGDPIDPSVGIVFLPKIGDGIVAGQELGRVHARSDGDAEAGIRAVHAAMTIGDEPVEPPPLVYGWHG
jgi:thymidine phosphorylase